MYIPNIKQLFGVSQISDFGNLNVCVLAIKTPAKGLEIF